MDQFIADNSTDILYQHASDVTWVPCNKLHVGNYEKVHYDTVSDVAVLTVMSKENTHTCNSRQVAQRQGSAGKSS